MLRGSIGLSRLVDNPQGMASRNQATKIVKPGSQVGADPAETLPDAETIWLEPSPAAGNASSVHAICSAQFGDCFGQVIAHGSI